MVREDGLREVTGKHEETVEYIEFQVAVKGAADLSFLGNNFKTIDKVGEKGLWQHLDREKVGEWQAGGSGTKRGRKDAEGISGEEVKQGHIQHNIWINKKEKGKLVVSISPRPKLRYASNPNAKLILESNRVVKAADGEVEAVSSSSSDSERGLFGNSVKSRGECSTLKHLLVEDPLAERGVRGLSCGRSQEGNGIGLDSSFRGPISFSDGNSSDEGPQGDNYKDLGLEPNGIEFHIDLRGGPRLTCGLAQEGDITDQAGGKEILRSKDVVQDNRINRGESSQESLVPTKGRKGGKHRYSIKSHGMRTRNAKLKELKALEATRQEKSTVELKEGVLETGAVVAKTMDGKTAQILPKTEIKLVDVEGNRVMWTMEEEIMRVIETGAALGFEFSDKEDVIREELKRRELEDKGNRKL
ncbi:hypothetical protein Q3G72_025073 [Acer saccharum]|nr:hypothetical protein Q3G72_025073 [Acer saccharum]